MSSVINDPKGTMLSTTSKVHGTNIHNQALPQDRDTVIQHKHKPTPFATTDASGYPDKSDGLIAHQTPQSIQDPHEHHKHTLIDEPLVELAEKLQDPLLSETAVP
ncbi:hypothetical protein BGZ93_011190 [Podila epicladia]|nr:hypothetical protein BGZ92_001039 [Podila epicladia]KAG0087033.1 hypothetical protein BGZ93_011190 [Podila epicladia]